MKQDYETRDIIDLGSVSTGTEGSTFLNEDAEGGMRFKTGLTDD